MILEAEETCIRPGCKHSEAAHLKRSCTVFACVCSGFVRRDREVDADEASLGTTATDDKSDRIGRQFG